MNNKLETVCCVCNKVRLANGTWKHKYYSKWYMAKIWLSHGYCPECYIPAMQKIHEWAKSLKEQS